MILNVFKNALYACVVTLYVTGKIIAQNTAPTLKTDVPLDSIRLGDPFILADKPTQTYYMTGTGGKLWKSRDLRKWTGPFSVAQIDPKSWMGPAPMIWAAELHAYNGKYYYFATFTNKAVKLGEGLERRACHVLVSDQPDGPYVPMKDSIYLPADKLTLDATLWTDTDHKPYMIFCHEWLQNDNGTIEKIALKPDFSGTTGSPKLLFRASDSPWSRERNKDGSDRPNKVTDGPWIQGKEPITPPNFGHGMLFRTFDGKPLMAIHSHKSVNGRTVRYPKLFEVDDSGDKLVIGKQLVDGR
jgi:hypothetical protein